MKRYLEKRIESSIRTCSPSRSSEGEGVGGWVGPSKQGIFPARAFGIRRGTALPPSLLPPLFQPCTPYYWLPLPRSLPPPTTPAILWRPRQLGTLVSPRRPALRRRPPSAAVGCGGPPTADTRIMPNSISIHPRSTYLLASMPLTSRCRTAATRHRHDGIRAAQAREESSPPEAKVR